MKKLGITYICESDEKSIIFARHQALSSVITSLFACDALVLNEEKLDTGQIKISLSIMVDEKLKPIPVEMIYNGMECVARNKMREFRRKFPYFKLS